MTLPPPQNGSKLPGDRQGWPYQPKPRPEPQRQEELA